ncbi:MAG TPA: UDP-N-acetylglucosamine diphosphorylase/glucosamine-1-phosphate N-acetyltransferase [Methyloprofundus sp.]|uniref:bifunctional UDP-N-acetylglucosamine diphosphorylase/glucosamine-1-phosphate N-acetyltransferase GlmU n=1 Tax=Methyloprofundus sp. TaxID=2020875 RepID=UPI0017984B0F|nr:bifunctional UDP-N-acetylglucosamine diphosphorylase/glucosamine-1-phosphate N-acetyltransferase GlmU [Methyloprofundus sp.]MBT5826801.1 bifunctional UDP-N-acetylglucosamine diphosphorylase/glucosamine-1-phosphate N-acetyltransferase GlmU [Gammaproteobacteria bacterium]MBT6575364.1 bifunctional UDP-N-acetylglucosamine diphosphorylase/glucosamine-1-phosphate N-acetyltransferase GlmU [Gammaproteobacteria bacterium]HIG65278.1 UDP-N-acetylglucosamine diphosphorylase/glucosamine-1-phosphate N-acet
MTVKTIILAAGQGTRMRSVLPKVLHKVANRSLLEHVYDTSKQIDDNEIIIVYGHGGELVKETLSELEAKWVEQKEQLGTGHAVLQVDNLIGNEDTILILYGDVPLLSKRSIDSLLAKVTAQSMALLTVVLENPVGYGRIVRDAANKVLKIVEQKDATEQEQLIDEVNTGILAVKGEQLKSWISRLDNSNAQQEFYLTDVIEMAVNDGIDVKTSQPESVDEVLGVNNRKQLSHLERVYQAEQADKLMEQGITLLDPARVDCRGSFDSLGQDISVDINVIFEGNNTLGNNVKIGANTIIINSKIADNVEILANCIIDNAVVGAGSRIGPFARLRPQAELAEQVHVGNFVEIKKSTVAQGSKINHLSYIGDATIGSNVNIGAGTITCNYDGVNKFRTVIEDGAFIGSDTQLIAPVTVGKNATIGAGSTITKSTPDEQLTLTRSKQMTIHGWQRPVKKEQ